MRTPTPPNTEPTSIAKLCAPTIPVVDWRPVHGSLAAFRSGYEEIEQFVSQLLDEVDAAWQELDAERARVDESRAMVLVEAQAGTAMLLPPVVDPDQHRQGESLQRRITELEEDRYALQAEVEFTRNQLAEQAKQFADERRQAAAERATWAGELRLLREAIHEQMAAFNALPPKASEIVEAATDSPTLADVEHHGRNDPVLGPLLTQFKILQRDATRRREMGGSGGQAKSSP